MSKFTRTIGFATVLLLTISCITFFAPKKTEALAGSDFNPGYIIDDSIFFNSNTMNTGDIQNFLNAKRPNCASGYTCLKDYSQSFDSRSADAYCGGISGGNKSAANIIFDVSRACGINPQSLIVLLQKEQSLILEDSPSATQYQKATGYGCPDTAPCDSQYYGFFNQVYMAGRQFKRYVQLPQNYNYAAGRTSFIGYNPNGGCGGTNVTVQNPATAALYNYTPYQPNQAALNNLYGTGDGCSAYGNRNFWRLFNDWFGPTTSNGYVLAKSDDDGDLRQWVIYGGIKQYVPSGEIKRAWNLPDQPIEMDANYLASISTGPNLDRLMRLNSNSGVLYFVDNGKRYAVPRTSHLNTWNIAGMTTSYVSQGLFNLPSDGGYLSYALKGPSSSTIYMTDGANGSNQTVIRPYASEQAFRAWEGDSAYYTEVSSDLFNAINDAIGSTISHTKVAYGGSEYQVTGGYRMAQSISYAALFPGVAQSVSNATFDRLMPTASVQYLIRSKSNSALYLLDNGQKHHILWPDVLSAWAAPNAGYHTLDDNYINLIPTGDSIGAYRAEVGGQLYVMDGYKLPVPESLDDAYRTGASIYTASSTLMGLFPTGNQVTGFIKGRNSPQIYLLDNSGQKRHLEWSDKVELWATNHGLTVFGDYIVNNLGSAASPQIFVSDGTNEYVMENGRKLSVSAPVKAEWGLSSPQVYSDGTLDRFAANGSLGNELRTNGTYFIVRDGVGYGTVDPNIADMWNIDGAAVQNPKLVSSMMPYYSLTRFVRSTTDNRTFIVDNGNWYNLDVGPRNNLGGPNEPAMSLNPNNAPNSITDWLAFVVKDSQGTHYVIDGGGKRSFNHQMILDHWTGHGSLTVPTVTDGFLNILPYRGIIERTIKGTSPMIYSAENGTKRHILYSDTYHKFYAPYGNVSERLLDTMPNGQHL